MIEPVVDHDGRLQWVSIVPPLSADESAALLAALKQWKDRPIIWSHNEPEVQIIQLSGRFEPDIEDTP
jgi:hypothetical protein